MRHCFFAPFSEMPCDGPMDRCHLIPKQRIKREHKGIGKLSLHRIIWHPSVWVWGCRRHHGDFDARHLRISRSDLPAKVEMFASAMDMQWSLERDYGPIS